MEKDNKGVGTGDIGHGNQMRRTERTKSVCTGRCIHLMELGEEGILADIRGSQMGRSSSDQETQAAVREKHQGEEQGNIPGQGKNRRHISEPTHRPSNASNYNSREHNPTVYSTSS